MRVAVVTPTIGSEHLPKCLESIQTQTYENVVHYVFLDGKEHHDKIHPFLYEASGTRTIKTVQLEDNVGKGWYGHRVYAACSFLVNADVICYLDEDNWYDENHIETVVESISKGYQWVYALRKIYDKSGEYICDDNCESLGKWPVYFNDEVFHVDTACFAVRRDVAVAVGHSWYGQWGADRQFHQTVKKYFTNYASTGLHTVCYRLDGNDNSVKKEFFEQGNDIMKQRFGSKFPWNREV